MEPVMTDFAKHERRQMARRLERHDHRIVAARVRPGHAATVIDVSAGGALVETAHRLLPGSSVELQMETSSRRASIRGRVLRCAVSMLQPSSVCYRGAIGFDRPLSWFSEDGSGGYRLPAAEKRTGHPPRAETTPPVV
jgi:hypothetical protein